MEGIEKEEKEERTKKGINKKIKLTYHKLLQNLVAETYIKIIQYVNITQTKQIHK